jgi:Cell division septal protein
VTASSIAVIGVCVLLVAANGKQKEHVCKNLIVSVKTSDDNFYIQKSDIVKQVEKLIKGSVVNRKIAAIDMQWIERNLKSNHWIYSAQLFFDTKDILNIVVKEREPVARVYSEVRSFYIDSTGQQMPLLDNATARLPVILGYPFGPDKNNADSSLRSDVVKIATYIYYHPLWNAQIGEIIVREDRKFDLVPVLGDHVIELGYANNIDTKLDNLLVFYKQVLSKIGLNHYSAINIEFNGQVIGRKKENTSSVDSAQLQKNIAALLNKKADADSNAFFAKNNTADSLYKDQAKQVSDTLKSIMADHNLSNTKKTNQSNPTEEPKKNTPAAIKKPKAVMKKLE